MINIGALIGIIISGLGIAGGITYKCIKNKNINSSCVDNENNVECSFKLKPVRIKGMIKKMKNKKKDNFEEKRN